MLPYILLALLFLITVAGFLGHWGWLWELTSHFRWHNFVLLMMLALLFVAVSEPLPAVLSGFLGSINLLVVLPLFDRNGHSQSIAAPAYRAVMLNMHWTNEDFERTITFIRQTGADFVILVEVTPEGERALQALNSDYPFSHPLSKITEHGVMLFSRIPFTEAGVWHLEDRKRPSVVAQLAFRERPLTIIGMHPSAPMRPNRIKRRNLQINQMASFVAAQSSSIMLMGDLNMTPWSPYFHQFIQQSGLVNGRIGHGLQPTWPAQLPLLRIPIDHALVSADVTIHAFKAGPNVGSDHLPIIVDFSL